MLLGFVLTSTGVALCLGVLALAVTNGTTLYLSTRQHTSQRVLDSERWRRDRLVAILHNVLQLSHADADLVSNGMDADTEHNASAEIAGLILDLNEARLDLDLFADEVYRRRAFALSQLASVAASVRHDERGWSNWQAWRHNERAALVEFARSDLAGLPDWSLKGSQRPSVLDAAKERFGKSTLTPEAFLGSSALPAPPHI